MNRRRLAPFRHLFFLLIAVVLAGCGQSGPQGEANGSNGSADGNGTASGEAAALAQVAGRVAVPRGMDPSGVTVFASGTSFAAWTDEEGRYTISNLPPGDYTFRAQRPDLEPGVIGDLSISRAAAMAAQPVAELPDAILKAAEASGGRRGQDDAGTLRGKITTVDTNDLGGVTVELVGTGLRAATDTAGEYTLYNIPEGVYELRFNRPGYLETATTAQVIADETTTAPEVALSPDVAAITGTRTLFGSVRLLGPDGTPMGDPSTAIVSLVGTDQLTTPNADGSWQIGGLAPGGYLITAQAEDYRVAEAVEVDLTELESAQVDLTMLYEPDAVTAGTGSLVGVVTLLDSANGSSGGVMVSLLGTDRLAMTDRTGSFAIDGIAPGTYDLVAERQGYLSATRIVNVAAGEQTDVGLIELEPDIEYPVVVASDPADGANNVTVANPTVISITFSQPMDPLSLRAAISIRPEVQARILTAGMHPLAQPNRVVIEMAGFAPGGNPLRYDTRYTVTVSEAATNVDGIPMQDPFDLRFRTGSVEIIATDPPQGAEGVLVDTAHPVRFFFNAPIDHESIDPRDVTIRPDPPAFPNVYVANDQTTGWSMLVLAGFLDYDTEYTITVGRGAQTVAGDRPSNVPYRLKFRTADTVPFVPPSGTLDGRLEQERERR
ncbi:MAG: carboxypeptidase regulatory-like domain-containing protein [Sumerlaeia bacterium]